MGLFSGSLDKEFNNLKQFEISTLDLATSSVAARTSLISLQIWAQSLITLNKIVIKYLVEFKSYDIVLGLHLVELVALLGHLRD